MAILVKDALSLDIMKGTKLLAGENGLDRLIQWVTIVEIIEDTSRLSEGELLVTTGFGLADNQERRDRLEELTRIRLTGADIAEFRHIPRGRPRPPKTEN